jgi:hypothetical protein
MLINVIYQLIPSGDDHLHMIVLLNVMIPLFLFSFALIPDPVIIFHIQAEINVRVRLSFLFAQETDSLDVQRQ